MSERKRFNSRVQAEGETFDDFVTSLRDLSRSCNFCRSCNESLIRDKIVIGLRCADTVQKLCAVPKLSLASAISLCRAQEAATRDAGEIRSSDVSACQVGAADCWNDLPPGTTCRVCSRGGRPRTSHNRRPPGETNASSLTECGSCGLGLLKKRISENYAGSWLMWCENLFWVQWCLLLRKILTPRGLPNGLNEPHVLSRSALKSLMLTQRRIGH